MTTSNRDTLLSSLDAREKQLADHVTWARVPREELRAALEVVEEHRQGRFWPAAASEAKA